MALFGPAKTVIDILIIISSSKAYQTDKLKAKFGNNSTKFFDNNSKPNDRQFKYGFAFLTLSQ